MVKKNVMLICSGNRKKNHCLDCYHGKPHPRQSERDECHNNYEVCSLSGKIQKVICIPIKEKK